MDLFVFFVGMPPTKTAGEPRVHPMMKLFRATPLITSRRFNDLKSFQDIPNGSEWPHSYDIDQYITILNPEVDRIWMNMVRFQFCVFHFQFLRCGLGSWRINSVFYLLQDRYSRSISSPVKPETFIRSRLSLWISQLFSWA